MNNESASFVQIQKNSIDWSKIEHLLQLSLGTSTAVIKNLWTIFKPSTNLEFERFTSKRKMMTVPSFIDTAHFEKGITPETIADGGFEFPPEGRAFSTGFINLKKPNSAVYQLILCKVAIGKSLCLNIKEDEIVNILREDLDKEFDSVYVKIEDEDKYDSVYRYDYIVYENGQVHPEYLVEFEFDESKESNLKVY